MRRLGLAATASIGIHSRITCCKSKDLTWDEVRRHNSEKSCYIAVDGKVYDVTSFLKNHPGGSKIVVNHAGADASRIFHHFHSTKVLREVAAPYQIGRVTGSAPPDTTPGARKAGWEVDRCTVEEVKALVNIKAVEEEALKRLPPALGAGFIGYGSEDNMSLHANIAGYKRYVLRPRMCVDVSDTSAITATSILGGRVKLQSPVCVGPFTNAKAVHPDGEVAVASAVAAAGQCYCVPQ